MSRLAFLVVAMVGCKPEYTITPLTSDTPPEDADYGQWLQMGTAPDGAPVIAYYDVTEDALGFGVGSKGADGAWSWTREEVDGYPDSVGIDTGDRGKYASMAVGSDGHVWIAYQDVANKNLRVAHRVGGIWQTELADGGTGPTPEAGRWASLALDADNQPVVAHYDAGARVLRVARKKDGAWSAITAHEGVDYDDADGVHRDADVGAYAALAIQGSTEYIAFYDTAYQRLDLLEGFDGSYTLSTVWDQGNVGQWPSIWTDGDTLVIAFNDVSNGDLMVATRQGGGQFQVQRADAGDWVGADTEVFIRDGSLNVLYFDGYNNDMLHAVQAGDGSWSRAVLGAEGRAMGFFNEATRTGDGTWLAGSYDYTNRKLVFQEL
jgi:hypothetical protein